MKKIWLVGLGAILLGTAMSANASFSFVWAHATETGSGNGPFTFTDTADGGTVTVTYSLTGAATNSPGFPALIPGGVGEAFRADFTGAGAFDFSVTSSVPFVSVSSFASTPLTLSTSPVEIKNPSGGGGITFHVGSFTPTSFAFTESVSGGTFPQTAGVDLNNIVFTAVPEVNQVAIGLAAALVGATVLLRFRRSSVA